MQPKKINELITEAMAIEAEDAKEAGALGYMCRSLVQATLPHKSVKGNEFSRTNGAFTLSLMAPSSIGLPYGTMPRLLVAWLTSEAVKTKQRELVLGNSLTDFLRELGLERCGGARGDITRLKNQMHRLFSSFISCTYTAGEQASIHNLTLVDSANLWWEPKTSPDQISLFESTVTLSQRFFDEITQNPVPIDTRALYALKRSPMAIDIYCWLTYRMFTLRKYTPIPWEALQLQFGADYSRARDFKAAFLEQLAKVQTLYPEAKVAEDKSGLILYPSPPHITPTKRLR